MHDLRRQALESGKTISRKALSREGSRSGSRLSSARNSRPNSRQNSRQSSRAASRYASEDEDNGSLSDGTAFSTTSFDELDNPEADNYDWPTELAERIEELLDRKRSSVQGREEALAAYCRLSKYHYVEEHIRGHIQDLLGALSKSIKHESSVRETTLALKALELMAVTANDDRIYDAVEPLLTRTIRDSKSMVVKAAAIHCLGTCTYFGGTGEEGKLDQMNFFLDIVASDGHSIDAPDDAGAVTAALQQWGFLATDIEDLAGESEEAVESFIEQLESSEPRVQIAAGENIALLYEKSYTPRGDDDDDDEDSSGEDSDSDSDDDQHLVKRYDAYHDTRQLEQLLQSLATVSGKHISKRDRKTLHTNFSSILTTVENPRRGPMYSKAIDQDTNRRYGSKRRVRIGRDAVMNVDRWWKWIRLASLRRILQGGFLEHYYQGNRAVLNSLPMILQEERPMVTDRAAAKKAAKYRNSVRRMVLEEDMWE